MRPKVGRCGTRTAVHDGNGGAGGFVDDGGGIGRKRECKFEVGNVNGQGLDSVDANPVRKYTKR